jgi:hypothetical protein
MIPLVTDYLLHKLPTSFQGWTREAVEDYVIFHAQQNTLKVALQDGHVVAVLVGWRQMGPEPKEWTWQKSDPNGDHWYWHQFAADCALFAMAVAAKFFHDRPESAILPAIGHRNGKLTTYKKGSMPIYRVADKKYGNIS